MKKTLILGILITISFLTFNCRETTSKNDKLSFEQIGYYKNDSKLRYFTFWIESNTTIVPDSISDKIYNEIKEHGSKQMNTSGNITGSFYYLDKEKAPDITLLSAQEANDLAHNRKPIAVVWIMPNGQINFIKSPE